jgi:Polyphosphate kinase 2 (PPK2)
VHEGTKVCIVFEGRDTAGKGGVIKRITERVSPRVFRVVALPAPTEREKSQMYVQRHLPHFPAAGEVVIFDRSWHNRAGVERVMGFCSEDEAFRFLRLVPLVEQAMVDSGIILYNATQAGFVQGRGRRIREGVAATQRIPKGPANRTIGSPAVASPETRNVDRRWTRSGRAPQKLASVGARKPSICKESPLTDSNRRPLPYHGSALPAELRGRTEERSACVSAPAGSVRQSSSIAAM